MEVNGRAHTDTRAHPGAFRVITEPATVAASQEAQPVGRVLRFAPDLYTVALIAMLGAILVVGLAPRLDTDFWWHLKDGQYIVQHHVVPAKDFMSFTMAGHAWTDHEWLSEILLYGSFRLAGLWGPIVLFAGIILATFALVYAQMRLRGVHPVVAIFMLAVGFMASSASWGPRIQMLTLFFLAAYGLVFARFDISRDRRLFLWFPALMLFWANMHGGFALGLAVLVLVLVGQWLNHLANHADAWSRGDLRYMLYATLGACAVTMVNPNGYRQLLYPLTFVLPNAYTNLIQESASPNFHMPIIMIFEGLLLITIAALYASRRRLDWSHLALFIPFTHLALSQVRNVAVWAVVLTPLLAVYVQSLGPALRFEFPRVSYKRRPVRGSVGRVLNVVMLLLVIVVYVAEGAHYVNGNTLRTAETDNFPVPAIAYMQTHHLPTRVFVSYSWGGYLLWHLFPTYRDFMDSRADTLYNDQILNDYLHMYTASANWRSLLSSFHIGTVLVERGAPLVGALSTTPGWHLRYEDSESALYSR
jgi:hypothetical protein